MVNDEGIVQIAIDVLESLKTDDPDKFSKRLSNFYLALGGLSWKYVMDQLEKERENESLTRD